MEKFDYYQHYERLIRVNGDNKHYRDITPNANYNIPAKDLHISFSQWMDKDYDDGSWIFLAHLELHESERFQRLYSNFSSAITKRNKPKRKRSIMTPELTKAIIERLGRGEPVNAVAAFFGVSWATVDKLRKEGLKHLS